MARSWKGRRGNRWDRGGGRGRMGSRVDDDDAWEEAGRGRRSGRGRKDHARNGCDDHRTGIRGDDDGIEFGERGSGRGLEKGQVELVGDHIAYDLAHGSKATDGRGRVPWRRGKLGIGKRWGCGEH